MFIMFYLFGLSTMHDNEFLCCVLEPLLFSRLSRKRQGPNYAEFGVQMKYNDFERCAVFMAYLPGLSIVYDSKLLR